MIMAAKRNIYANGINQIPVPEIILANLPYFMTSSAVKTTMCQDDIVHHDCKVAAVDNDRILGQAGNAGEVCA